MGVGSSTNFYFKEVENDIKKFKEKNPNNMYKLLLYNHFF